MTPEFKLRLTDATLFGNESAEDETEEVFNSYAIERPELESFVSPRLPLLVARAYKGEGKSALLRLTARNAVHQPHVNVLVIQKTAASVTPDLESDDYSKWVRAWKSSILNALASHIGTTLGTAWSDDAMTLVEKAEREGDKSKGFVGSVLARLSP